MEKVMAPRKKWFAAVLILLILALAVGGAAYLLSRGLFNGAGREPSGTWSVEESFPGSPVSDFTVTVQNLKKATNYELHVDGVQIGERVTLDGSIRSVPLIFSKPDLMEVWFYDSEDAAEPIAKAGCHQSGALIFPGSEGAFVNDNNTATDGNDDSSGSALPSEGGNGADSGPSQPDGKKSGGGLFNGLKRWWRTAIDRLLSQSNAEKPEMEIPNKDEPDGAMPDKDDPSENNQENDLPEADSPAGEPAGKWSVEPDTPPTAVFTVSVVNIDPEAYYELHASGIMVGERVSLEEGVRSISLMYSDSSLLKVRFFANRDTTSLLAEAECTDEGDLKFIE
jgi:hypothetical protein